MPSTNLLELSPWNHEPASVGAWIWETAAREGPWGIRQTACRALPLARLAVAAQEQVEWLPILEMMRHTYEGKHLTTEVRCARDELPFVEREEDTPQDLARRSADLAADAFGLAHNGSRTGDWWADCASIVRWSIRSIEAAAAVLEIGDSEAIAICSSAVVGTDLLEVSAELASHFRDDANARARHAASWTRDHGVVELLRRLAVPRAHVEEARERGWSLTDWWASTTRPSDQVRALHALGLDAERRAALFAEITRPLVERVPFPSDARLARHALSNAAPADLDAGFALAMGVMLEAEDIMVRDENGELDPPGPGRPELRPAAIWQTGEACALVALERAGIEEGEIAKHLVHASILLDPEAPPSEVIRDERRVEQHAAALADLIRARFPRATL